MNIKGDIGLDLALDSTSYIPTSSNNSSGAGVNASGKVDMGFAASDPLSELVWSPHNGLRLKCADSGLTEKRPSLMWNVGPSTSKCLSTSHSGQEKVGEGSKLTMFQTVINVADKFGDRAASVSSSSNSGARQHDVSEDKVEETCPKGAIHKGENDDEEDDVCSPQHVEIADATESSKENNTGQETHGCNRIIGQFSGRTENNASGSSNNGFDMTKFSEAHVVSPLNSLPLMEPGNEVISTSLEVNISKTSSPARLLQKLEFSGENDFLGQNSLSVERSPTNSRICTNRDDKGKEKASSDGDIYGRSSNDSHESVKSCNSASLFAKGSKRQSCAQEMIVGGSKRTKKHGRYGSTSIFGPNSSFMNWISNMVTGLSDSNKQECSSLALTVSGSNNGKDHHEKLTVNGEAHDSAKLNRGFRTMFQSMYCRNTNISDTQINDEENFIEDRKELVIAEKSFPESIQPSFDRQIHDSCKQIVVSDKEVNVNPSIACSSYACESVLPEKSNHLASLWITRLYTTTKLENCNQITNKDPAISAECRNDNTVLQVNDSEVRKEIPSHKLMASAFARRLDALKQITPQDRRNVSTCKLTCFFCGRVDHDLRDCPQVTESELDGLLVKLSSLDRAKEFPCMCIRCLQLGHWAVSCPLVSSTHWQLEQNSSFGNNSTATFLKLFAGNAKYSSDHKLASWNVKESGSQARLASIAVQESRALNLENVLETAKSSLFCSVVNAHDTVSQAEMFQAVRKLRLSRSDILRWMSSNVSLSHLNGLFLRLRLGKLEAGLGGPGYYVARITGVAREYIGRKTNKSILVDVGGMKSSVGSQYVSNQEFLEDEIGAWWGRVVKNGGKIPSLDELNLKFEDRTSLGF